MDKINKERQNELERDYDSRFIAEQYTSEGYFYHFHRNVELYGVVHGIVAVTIAGETRVLTDGQIAVIDCLESHSYEIEGQADIFYFHIGTQYLREFRALYPQSRLPHWLMDKEYNELLMERIRPVIGGMISRRERSWNWPGMELPTRLWQTLLYTMGWRGWDIP